MSKMEMREGIKIAGHRGTWYVIDESAYSFPDEEKGAVVKSVYLLEHETYGDETACLIVDEDKNIILDDVWNGFDDLDEALECGYIE